MTETSRYELELPGCTPEPLMAYLKALGIFRLVGEQKDPAARGWWRHDVFCLRSPMLFEDAGSEEAKRDALMKFFLEEYQPTPIVAPWGARSGFYPGSSETTAREALALISASELPRLDKFRRSISEVHSLLNQLALPAKARDEDKVRLLQQCRSRLSDEVVPWLDACVLLIQDGQRYPPLLGTGGNEGSGSYVSGFVQLLVECILKRRRDDVLEPSLFATQARQALDAQTPGQFSPTAAGGANGTQGFEASTKTNPWDYVLCLEGACLWASAAVRRLGSLGSGMAAFPFTVEVSGSGSASLSFSDRKKPKQAKREGAEMWLPLWERLLSVSELSSVISEGRASVGHRQAGSGVDFARAASSLGVDRGIRRFTRTAFLMRNGQSFFSVPLGRFEVKERSGTDLLREADHWLEGFRKAAKEGPARSAQPSGASNRPSSSFASTVGRHPFAVETHSFKRFS